MPLQKTFTFTSNGTDSNASVFVPTVGEQSTGVFTATIENVIEIDNKAIVTVLFASSTVNYAKNYTFTPSGTEDLTSQGYTYLLTLPEFKGATTV